ncbi:MAG: hypothetical protein GY705_06245 [Bacteroidetes bacterium]|nr:hypothetical protein [Bacteroidota bacterium]
MRLLIFILTSAVLFQIYSCDRPECQNTNPVFENYKLESLEYKTELIKQIEKIGKENLSYWLDHYMEKNEQEYIVVNIQNGPLCAKGVFLIKNWNKIEGIKKSKGVGYRGAELKGFSFDIERESDKIELVYRDLERIID